MAALCRHHAQAGLSAWYWRGPHQPATHLRNRVLAPPFVIYYPTFLLPEAVALLRQQGFAVAAHPGLFPGRFHRYDWLSARWGTAVRRPECQRTAAPHDTYDRQNRREESDDEAA